MSRQTPLSDYPTMISIFFLCLLSLNGKVTSQVLTASLPSYAPVSVECPANQQLLRLAGNPAGRNQTLSQAEANFLRGRRSVTATLWREFFTDGPGKATGYQHTSLLARNQQNWPILGIAHSGGGLRASLYAAGVFQALDTRSRSSPVRGVYPLATYVTGLSGGSWLVASLAANNYPTASEMVSGWQLENDLVLPGGLNPLRNAQFLDALSDTVKLKQKAGYNVSLTDQWGRALGYHFLPGTNSENFYTNSPTTAHGAGMLFSSLSNTKMVREFLTPLPIIVSNHKPLRSTANPSSVTVSGSTYVPLSAPVYECSPFEFGSFDPQLSAFIPTQYLGTSINAGKPFIASSVIKATKKTNPKNSCVRGFDQLSFIMGSSATLFNAVTSIPTQYSAVLSNMASRTSGSKAGKSLTARYPNSFKGVNGPAGFDRSNSNELEIVDGGENGENIPFNPLLAPARHVDVILAADASRDSGTSGANGAGWPNGSSMINTFLRVTKILPAGTANFPPVPLDPKIWEQRGFSSRPTFFGCEAPIKQGNGGYPLVIYLPNSPTHSPPFTNYSTFKIQYSKEETSSFLKSVMESTSKPRIPTRNGDADWPTCLSCALIDRARNRQGVPRSRPCQNCFQRYCFS
ncbi:Lysophospholipase 1 [Puccinia graminis f. sp. tritici]|uniref:Lysophospholipase n=1 Tax=Puccinia graminis f. sp. tritici TaxID=56615 RepID=A0A5B0LXX0_PUCGR|nr:Lysophospholipase 1 [Puccinia graminis f. sp. tritici]KAA1104199.1 Lysophospholipase 1 [Puccinia graminis f. sp. tritici]